MWRLAYHCRVLCAALVIALAIPLVSSCQTASAAIRITADHVPLEVLSLQAIGVQRDSLSLFADRRCGSRFGIEQSNPRDWPLSHAILGVREIQQAACPRKECVANVVGAWGVRRTAWERALDPGRLRPSVYADFLGTAGVRTLRTESVAADKMSPPPPIGVPPNASRITGILRTYVVWPPGSLNGTSPPVSSDRTYYSVTVEIRTAEPVDAHLESLAQAGGVVDAFSAERLSDEGMERPVSAVLRLSGGTSGVRWWISSVVSLP